MELKDWLSALIEERLAVHVRSDINTGQGRTPRPNASSTIERQIENIISCNNLTAGNELADLQAKFEKHKQELHQSTREMEKKLQKQILGALQYAKNRCESLTEQVERIEAAEGSKHHKQTLMEDSERFNGQIELLRGEIADLRLVSDKQDALQRQLQKSLASLLKQAYDHPDDVSQAVRKSYTSVNNSLINNSKVYQVPSKKKQRTNSVKSRAESSSNRRKTQKSNPRQSMDFNYKSQ